MRIEQIKHTRERVYVTCKSAGFKRLGNDICPKEWVASTVETRYNEVFWTGKSCLFIINIRYFVISAVKKKQYKTKQLISLGPAKIVCYIRYLYIEFPL